MFFGDEEMRSLLRALEGQLTIRNLTRMVEAIDDAQLSQHGSLLRDEVGIQRRTGEPDRSLAGRVRPALDGRAGQSNRLDTARGASTAFA